MQSLSIRLRILVLLLITQMIALAGPIIYEQPSVSPPVLPSTSQYFPDVASYGFNVFDDFTLTANASIADVHWRGHYFNLLAGATDIPAANSTGFGVGFFSDNAGEPGTQLAPYSFTPSQAHEGLVGVYTVDGREHNLFDYWVDLPSAFNAAAGVTYWLRIVAFSPIPTATEAQWGWGRSSSGGTAQQYSGLDSSFFAERDDRAFALSTADPVPEPSPLIMVSTALFGVAFLLRRRRPLGT